MPEKFYTVVFVRIVRGGEDDPGIRAKRSSDISNTRGGQRTDNENIDAERGNAGDERVLEHVPRKPRIFTEHNFRPCALGILARIELRKNMRGGAPKFQCRFCRDRFNVSDAAHAVRPENLFLLRHGLIETLER